MADLSDIEAAQAVKVVGSSANGTEQTPIQSNANGKIHTSDLSDNGGVEGVLTVGTTAVELKVGATALANRVSVTISNTSTAVLYWGRTAGVTTATGTPIYKKQFIDFPFGPNSPVYVIAGTAANDVRVTEGA